MALDQEVTTPKPIDPVFKDFPRTWRQFVSTSAELAMPVIVDRVPPKEPLAEPIILAECVAEPELRTLVPQVTITWNEAAPPPVVQSRTAAQVAQVAPVALAQRVADTGGLRFDLALHHDGFGRNYFSAVLANGRDRFRLPSNSGLVADQEAVLLTGSGLFPKLVDFRTEQLLERDSDRRIGQHTMVLRDLSQGLTYTIRVNRPAANGWTEERRVVFLTPVCPESF